MLQYFLHLYSLKNRFIIGSLNLRSGWLKTFLMQRRELPFPHIEILFKVPAKTVKKFRCFRAERFLSKLLTKIGFIIKYLSIPESVPLSVWLSAQAVAKSIGLTPSLSSCSSWGKPCIGEKSTLLPSYNETIFLFFSPEVPSAYSLNSIQMRKHNSFSYTERIIFFLNTIGTYDIVQKSRDMSH